MDKMKKYSVLAAMAGVLSIIVMGAYGIAAEAGDGVLSWLGYFAIGCSTLAGFGGYALAARLNNYQDEGSSAANNGANAHEADRYAAYSAGDETGPENGAY